MKTIIQMLAVLSIIGVVSGGSLYLIDDWAQPMIKANKELATNQAIKEVQPATEKSIPSTGAITYFTCLDSKGDTVGYALKCKGNGFQGAIEIIVGLSKDLNTITKISVLEQSETPGLGTKILEDEYAGQYLNLVVTDGIKKVKPGEGNTEQAKKEGKVETITGATISTKSVIAIVDLAVKDLKKHFAERGA